MADTELSLDSLGYGVTKTSALGDSESNYPHHGQHSDNNCRLVLGLGPSPSCCPDDHHLVGTVKHYRSSSMLSQPSDSDSDCELLKLGLSRGSGEFLGPRGKSASFQHEFSQTSIQNQLLIDGRIPIVDEGSTSAKRKSGGYMATLLTPPNLKDSQNLHKTPQILEFGTLIHLTPEASAATNCSAGTTSGPALSGAPLDQRGYYPKRCRFEGCPKGARGASGLCIAHGGGQRCQKPGCNRGAERHTAYCKSHGGGKRCQHLGCTKSAEGKTEYCIAHGGGKRCGYLNCKKAARGKSGLCIRHGGGKRCKIEGCTRSAEGQAGLCISHGGGRRCQQIGCNKGAQGSTMYCKAHGGGKRCVFAGCTKGAEGRTPLCKRHGGGKRCLFGGGICPKSVHGGTDYCVAHGGGKRCAVQGCTKSARGRTDCCVRHGGGKRCQYENCVKSAQGSTDFCKAHGGGKRCSWGQGACDKFARGRSGLCATHGNLVQEQDAGKRGGMIDSGLLHGLVSVSVMGSSIHNNCSTSEGASTVSEYVEWPGKTSSSQLIPPQVLVPESMKSPSSSGWMVDEREGDGSKRSGTSRNFSFTVPEGRVHGGFIMSLLKGNLNNSVDGL